MSEAASPALAAAAVPSMCTDDAAVTALVAEASRSAADSEVFDVAGVVAVAAGAAVDAAGAPESPHPTRPMAGAASNTAAMSGVRSDRVIASA